MTSDAGAMAPELVLLLGGLATLVGGSFTPRTRQWRVRALAAAVAISSAAFAAYGLSTDPRSVFQGTYAVDDVTGITRLIVAGGLLLVLAMAGTEIAGHPRESEICSMLLFGATGVLLMADTQDLALLIVAFLLSSIPLYGLVAIHVPAASPSPRRSTEAALKTYLLAALFGTFLMLGVTILYGVSGSTSYAGLRDAGPTSAVVGGAVMVVGGLLFKAGAVPGHFWVPDAAEGASATAAAYLTTLPKVGALIAIARLLDALPHQDPWRTGLGVIAVATMTLGNLAAFTQDAPRRLLGWSTVSQVGYALVPVAVLRDTTLGVPALLLYLAAYTLTNIGAFAVTAALPGRGTLDSYAGLIRARPALAVSLVALLLGLLGTPPTGIFIAKLTASAAAWDGSSAWLAVALLINTVVSLFYYLRWLAPAVGVGAGAGAGRASRDAGVDPAVETGAGSTALAAAVLSVAVGVAGGPLWKVVDVHLLS